MHVEFVRPLFKDGSPEAAMWPFVGFAACVLLVVTILVAIGRPELALAGAWSTIVVEVILGLWRKVRLKVPFGLVLTLYGPVIILLTAWARS